jgi:hypothetical protein
MVDLRQITLMKPPFGLSWFQIVLVGAASAVIAEFLLGGTGVTNAISRTWASITHMPAMLLAWIFTMFG